MNIIIQAQGFELTEALRAHTLRRLQFSLHWAGRDVTQIQVRLADINGPKGGLDKRCHLQIRLSNDTDVSVEDTEDDLYVAIDRAIERSKRTITRRLERKRTQRVAFTGVAYTGVPFANDWS